MGGCGEVAGSTRGGHFHAALVSEHCCSPILKCLVDWRVKGLGESYGVNQQAGDKDNASTQDSSIKSEQPVRAKICACC